MKYLFLLFLSFLFFVFSCNNNVSVKVIEEHDPVVKLLEEKDSMVVFPTDSADHK